MCICIYIFLICSLWCFLSFTINVIRQFRVRTLTPEQLKQLWIFNKLGTNVHHIQMTCNETDSQSGDYDLFIFLHVSLSWLLQCFILHVTYSGHNRDNNPIFLWWHFHISCWRMLFNVVLSVHSLYSCQIDVVFKLFPNFSFSLYMLVTVLNQHKAFYAFIIRVNNNNYFPIRSKKMTRRTVFYMNLMNYHILIL
jgi:hypothetical protein